MCQDTLLDQSKQFKKKAEDILRQIESYNEEVKKAVTLYKAISHHMKETVAKAQSLRKEPLPDIAQQKINKYQEKYGQYEQLGFLSAHVNPCYQQSEIISFDSK